MRFLGETSDVGTSVVPLRESQGFSWLYRIITKYSVNPAHGEPRQGWLQREWGAAMDIRGAKFWLYSITHAGTDQPALTRLNDPASSFQLEQQIFTTGFIIPAGSWSDPEPGGMYV